MWLSPSWWSALALGFIVGVCFIAICFGLLTYKNYLNITNEATNLSILPENEKLRIGLLENGKDSSTNTALELLAQEELESDVEQPKPNIICLADHEFIWIEPDGSQFKVSQEGSDLSAVTILLENYAPPNTKIRTVAKVRAQVTYLSRLGYKPLEGVSNRINQACWLNEKTEPVVSFPRNQPNRLLFGAFRKEVIDEEAVTLFEIYDYLSSERKPVQIMRYHAQDLYFKLRLLDDGSGECLGEYEFEFRFAKFGAYSLHQITDEVRERQKRSVISRLNSYLTQGGKLLDKQNVKRDGFVTEGVKWRDSLYKYTIAYLDSSLRVKLKDLSKINPYPFFPRLEGKELRNELYTLHLNLEQIVKELEFRQEQQKNSPNENSDYPKRQPSNSNMP